MKRYLVFCFENYYPSGGWEDFDSSHETFEAAENRRQEIHGQNYQGRSHIVDLTTGKIVIQQFDTDAPESACV